jgi:hypothetical protein
MMAGSAGALRRSGRCRWNLSRDRARRSAVGNFYRRLTVRMPAHSVPRHSPRGRTTGSSSFPSAAKPPEPRVSANPLRSACRPPAGRARGLAGRGSGFAFCDRLPRPAQRDPMAPLFTRVAAAAASGAAQRQEVFRAGTQLPPGRSPNAGVGFLYTFLKYPPHSECRRTGRHPISGGDRFAPDCRRALL